jgi:hypothetical protein
VGRDTVLLELVSRGTGARVGLLPRVGAVFDDQPALALGQQRQLVGFHALLAHVADEHVVDRLARHRLRRHHVRYVVGGLEDRLVAEDQQRTRRRPRRELHRRLRHDRARALGADEGARDLEALLRQQLVEVEPRHAARDLREALADAIGFAVTQRAQRCVDPALAVAARAKPLELVVRRRADGELRAVVQDDVHRHDVVGRAPGHHRVRAAGVVADHAAERRVGVRRGVGREAQPVLALERLRELVTDHARLDARQPALRVDLDNVVHVARDVDDHGRVRRLAGE